MRERFFMDVAMARLVLFVHALVPIRLRLACGGLLALACCCIR